MSTEIDAEIHESLCKVTRFQEFTNNSTNAIEVLYEFPIEPKEVVHKMRFTFDDRVVDAKIMESEQA